MDPDVTIAQLRGLMTELEVQAEAGEIPDLGKVQLAVELWNTLDRWMIGGGFVPQAWGRRR